MSNVYIVSFHSQKTGLDNCQGNVAMQTDSGILVSADVCGNTTDDTVCGAIPRMVSNITSNYTIPNECDEVTHL